jgi:hypothetical protein
MQESRETIVGVGQQTRERGEKTWESTETREDV